MKKKLTLKKETIRQLSDAGLEKIAGGGRDVEIDLGMGRNEAVHEWIRSAFDGCLDEGSPFVEGVLTHIKPLCLG